MSGIMTKKHGKHNSLHLASWCHENVAASYSMQLDVRILGMVSDPLTSRDTP